MLLATCTATGLNFGTRVDEICYWFTFSYVLFNLLYWLLATLYTPDTQGVPVNALLGTLLLTLSRLYDGFECNYVTPVLFMLLARSFEKAAACLDQQEQDLIQEEEPKMHTLLDFLWRVTLLLDFALVALAERYGFRPLFASSSNADLFFVVLTVAACSLSGILRAQHHRPAAGRPPGASE